MSGRASAIEMPSRRASPNADSPYSSPYDIALILRRISGVTASGATRNTRAASVEWRSSPDSNAASSVGSCDRCAMTRSSSWP